MSRSPAEATTTDTSAPVADSPAPVRAPRRAKAASPAKVAKTAKPVKAAATPVAAPKATKPLKPASKAKPSPAAAAEPTAPAGKATVPKEKLVRDSFTMPRADIALIAQLKLRAHGFAHAARKSELLRAGLHALVALDDQALQTALGQLPQIKTGRPKKVR